MSFKYNNNKNSGTYKGRRGGDDTEKDDDFDYESRFKAARFNDSLDTR